MNRKARNQKIKKDKSLILALHSSSNVFGVATRDCNKTSENISSATFKVGRKLSNVIFTCIQEVLPSKDWSRIIRIAVATGPGGFTSTRLAVITARTLSQQLNCELDGESSFKLMVPRLNARLFNQHSNQPFWIINELPRRGIVAGKYSIILNSNENCLNINEIKIPKLYPKTVILKPAIEADEDVEKDILELLNICFNNHLIRKASPWKNIVPIYPTSPVDSNP
tara:strand:+ start:1714 stop:2388 length:675 start_codon:yes stop_codon:yes gene_type:complete